MALSPMMRQYVETKDKYSDCILFYRVGDFYEMFFEDAKLVSKELELVLTGKDCGLEERAPMSGIPYHAASTYIPRLISKGYKVAICEQVEDPKSAKGLVKRDVIKIVTPGTYIDNTTQIENLNTYLASIYKDGASIGLSVTDISTGEFKTTSFISVKGALLDELSKLSPKEIILDENTKESLVSEIKEYTNAIITLRDFTKFLVSDVQLVEQFSEMEVDFLDDASKISSKVLLKYIYETQKMSLTNINFLERYEIINYMTIDGSSRRNLELTESIRDKKKAGSLLWVLDKTATSMGARVLKKWVDEPLIIKKDIEKRLDSVEELFNDVSFNEDLIEVLKEIYDIERIVGKVASGNVSGKDLVSLRTSIEKIPSVKAMLSKASSTLLEEYYEELDELSDIRQLLQKSILDDPSMTLKEGNIIRDGYNEEVDELRRAKVHGKEWIASLENSEREFTGIKSLKVGYNKVFGYYIEITKSNYNLIPEGRYIRKQTLSNAERYITSQLKEMEDKILGAEEKLFTLEYDLFIDIRNNIEKEIPRLKKSAGIIGNLDALVTLAKVALQNDYVKPSINEEGIIDIKEGRHPVVEKVISNGEFVSNDTSFSNDTNNILLITGPNMAGKSTFMRQVALITLMAQMGSFVPAKSANISVCDKIFTRIGASDDLAGGKSTFMVEMWEVSNILKNATSKSLILLDEVGRGTSTYDGLSIAWSVIEHIAKSEKLGCKTLFATHYHELTNLEGKIKGVKNYSVAVKEIDDSIIFLRKIIEGSADQSYGIEVAKLAGLPQTVIKRANEILDSLEHSDKKIQIETREEAEIKKVSTKRLKPIKEEKENMQLDFSYMEKENLLKKLSNCDVINLTPLEAMNKLYEICTEAKNLQ